MLLALASLRESPGVTATALTMGYAAVDAGWEHVSIVEADADGGVLAHMFPTLQTKPNLLNYSLSALRDKAHKVFDSHLQPFGPMHVLTAPPLGRDVVNAINSADAVSHLLSVAAEPSRLIIADTGRISNIGAVLFERAHRRYLLLRPEQHVALAVNDLFDANLDEARRIHTIMVGEKPYSLDDVNELLSIPVAGVIADDEKAAEMVLGRADAKKFSKTQLYRSVADIIPDPSEAPPRPLRPERDNDDVEQDAGSSELFNSEPDEADELAAVAATFQELNDDIGDPPQLEPDEQAPQLEPEPEPDDDPMSILRDAQPIAVTDDGSDAQPPWAAAAEADEGLSGLIADTDSDAADADDDVAPFKIEVPGEPDGNGEDGEEPVDEDELDELLQGISRGE